MDRGHFPPTPVQRATLVRPAEPFTRSSNDSLWKSPLQQQPALFQECFPLLHLNPLKPPPREGERVRERGRRRERRRGRRRGTKPGREDRKPLDGAGGKFRECGPIFNSGFQATDEEGGERERGG